MIVTEFVPKPYTKTLENGQVTWESPSNIALVKYWGKKPGQIPANPSVSFTLNNCKTITTLTYERKETFNGFDFEVFLEGEKQDSFKPKIQTFFERIEVYLPLLKHYKFTIKTQNTFPHSSGIASSASGISALALCLMAVEKDLIPNMPPDYFNQKASFLARLGSGSACRSIEGHLVVWGAHKNIKGSSNFYGIKYPDAVHENFNQYQDTILLVDKGEKQVSSTVGHSLLDNHPYAEARFNQAHDNIDALKAILKSGDLNQFIALVESEALTLHAMMLTSNPYFILMKPNTLEIINKIWQFRAETNLHIGFTLDAGANVHVLYPKSEAEPILKFIKTKLTPFCQNGQYICDWLGFGARKIA
ncbi:MAG: diphosphomevalonate/mevalonate 3,5-bisphosphate decarboxylase family protein [Flavobacteriaceae bacterium]